MAIRVELEEAVPGLWCATISNAAQLRQIAVFDFEPEDALESAIRVWRIANVLRREARRKLN